MARGRKSKSTLVGKDWEKELGWKSRYYTVEKGALKGKQVGGFRIKNIDEESDSFLMWLNTQSNLSDAIRYLIEREIIENGIKDLAEYIPGKRNIEEKSSIPILSSYALSPPNKNVLEEINNKKMLNDIIQDKPIEELAIPLNIEAETIEKKLEEIKDIQEQKELPTQGNVDEKVESNAKEKAARWGHLI